MYDFKVKDEPFAVGYINADSDSIYVCAGMGYIEAARTVSIRFDTETGFPLLDFGNMACGSSFSSGQSPNLGLLLDKAQKLPDLADDYKYIAEKMKPYELFERMWSSFSENERDITNSYSGWGGTWGGHAVPDLIDFARVGTDGIRSKIHSCRKVNPDKEDFYEGLLLTLDAIDILGTRVYERAAEEYEKTKAPKLIKCINAFKKGLKEPAQSFSEALCVYILIFILDGIDSPGHFDQYMYPFWQMSNYSESREALEDVWIFFHKTRTWNLCISGSDENWNDISNSLTYEILDVARKYKFQTPNLTMRCHRNTPEELWKAAAETIACGIGMPVLYNDEVVCSALERLGICPADSHLYVMNGCNQIDIQGKSHMGLEDGEVNLGLAVSYALFGGHNIMQGKLIGAATLPAEELDTFDKFIDALKAQAVHICDSVCSMVNKAHKVRAEFSANPIRSMTIEGCIEKGLDYKNKGPLYGHGQILFEGVPDCIDSVANIKKYVYDEKKYTLCEVREAIRSDFEGYPEMLRDFKTSGLNFGNDVQYVDSIGKEIIDFCNSYLLTKKTERGGCFSGGCSPFERAAENGINTGALPNGKRRGEHLFGDSIGATPGKDVSGPTALLNSCLSFDHTLCGSGFILNLKFSRSLFCTEGGMDGFVSLAKTYFERGGQQLSVTVVDKKELLDALENPQDHRNLIVRVGGFSAYFVDLERKLQENIISRTMY